MKLSGIHKRYHDFCLHFSVTFSLLRRSIRTWSAMLDHCSKTPELVTSIAQGEGAYKMIFVPAALFQAGLPWFLKLWRLRRERISGIR